MDGDGFSVLIAGAGVAALEAALTLREVGEGLVDVQLLAPEPTFWYRPVAVAEPFGLGEVRHFDVGRLAEGVGAAVTLGSLASVDADRHEARTAAGSTFRYDALLLACGALPTPAVTGALTFRGPADTDAMRELLDEFATGEATRLAFAVPWGATWALPAYELALMTASRLAAAGVEDVELSLVTPEPEPLELFGRTASESVRALLEKGGIEFVGSAYAVELRDGELALLSGESIPADRVVALPRLRGQRLDGIPQTVEGFVSVDDHCGVHGVDAVFAAGDVTSFPVKQGGIAAQQAVAAAEAIAVLAGAALVPHPFRPVLRGLLLTGAEPQYLRRDLSDGGEGEPEWASATPIWWPPTKIVGRRIAPFLASLAGEGPVSDVPEPAGLPVEVALDRNAVERLATPTPAVAAPVVPHPPGRRAVASVMTHDPILVAPEATLDAVAREMREHDRGSVLVVADGRLVGILTARDVLRAVAGDASAGVAPVRRWMTADPVTAEPHTTLDAAEALMTEYGVHHLPVVEAGRPVGMVGLRDVTRSRRGTRRLPVGLGF